MKVCLTCPKLPGSFVIYWLEENILMTSCFPILSPKKCLQILEIFHMVFPPWKSMKWPTTQNNSSLFWMGLFSWLWNNGLLLGHNEVLMSLGRTEPGTHMMSWPADYVSKQSWMPLVANRERWAPPGLSWPLSSCNYSGGAALNRWPAWPFNLQQCTPGKQQASHKQTSLLTEAFKGGC